MFEECQDENQHSKSSLIRVPVQTIGIIWKYSSQQVEVKYLEMNETLFLASKSLENNDQIILIIEELVIFCLQFYSTEVKQRKKKEKKKMHKWSRMRIKKKVDEDMKKYGKKLKKNWKW